MPPDRSKEIIRRGEDVRTEFKLDLKNDDEYLETVVALANTMGVLVFVVATNDARISRFEAKSKDQISILIAGNTEPTPKFDGQQVRIVDRPITIVEVSEGDNSHIHIGNSEYLSEAEVLIGMLRELTWMKSMKNEESQYSR